MLIKKIGGEVERQHSDRVTHLVIFCDDGVPKTTIKFHQSILSGCWILSYNCKDFYILKNYFFVFVNFFYLKRDSCFFCRTKMG